MAGRIPPPFIDELLARADIVEIIGARVTLKRAGTNFKGLCPFHGENDDLHALLREADQIYRGALRDSPEAIGYLKQRGIDGATAGRFAMGYAPKAWDTVLRALGSSEARIDKLLQAGLVVANDSGRRYDRFRDRIMFPIRNPRGQ